MKRFFFMLMLALMSLSFSSCGGDVYYYSDQEVIQIKLTADRWTKMSSPDMPGYYAATFDVPVLTQWVYNTATVSCEMVYADARQPLPCVTHYKNDLGEMWTRTVDFQYGIRKVTVYVTNSDFYDEVPELMQFRLTMTFEED